MALLVGIGLLLGGCADACSGAGLAAQLGLAVAGFVAVVGIGALGVLAARRGWPHLAAWLVAVVVLARLVEFGVARR